MTKNIKTKIDNAKRPVGRPRIHSIREKRPVGRPRNTPILEPRPIGKQIEMLIACKMTPASIATAIGISEGELNRKYANEIRHGFERFQAELIHMVFETANRGNVPAIVLLKNIMARAAPVITQTPKRPRLGKKEQQQKDAEQHDDTFSAPKAPRLIVDNSKKPKR